MLSYSFNGIFSNNSFSNKKKLQNLKTYNLGFYKKTTTRINYNNFTINIPNNWNIVILLKPKLNLRVVFLYSKTYFLRFTVPSNKIDLFLNRNTSTLKLTTLYTTNFYKIYWQNLLLLFNSFHKPFFLKIKFKGKGYYIYKNKRQTITPQFGYSHRLYLYAYFVSVKFLSKTSVFLFGLLKSDIIKTGVFLKNMRSINIFTGRGVRFARQIVYKKVGKVSSYR